MSEIADQTASSLPDVVFPIEDFFYSRTDKQSVILAGNTLFQSLTGYEWEHLLGSEHKIIRNLETPRAAFRIVWEHNLADQAVVAYIRNRARDGRGYWVIALIMPLDDGYLSVRIKPTSPLFDKMRAIYHDISTAERDGGMNVEDSHKRMLEELSKLGYPDYDSYMMDAFSQEFRARSLTLSPKLKGYFGDIDRIKTALREIEKSQAALLGAVAALRDLPTNMRIVASRLEPSGGPLSAMSDIYNSTSSVLFREITEFALGQNSISKRMVASFERSCFFAECVTAAARSDGARIERKPIPCRH